MSYPDKYILSYQKLVMWEYVEVLTKTFRKKNCKIHASTISFWPKRPGHCWPDFGSKRHFYVCCVVLCCVVLCCVVLWCGVVCLKKPPQYLGFEHVQVPVGPFLFFFRNPGNCEISTLRLPDHAFLSGAIGSAPGYYPEA
jgi:hypothetical protein